MTQKNYSERVNEVKNDIIKEIMSLMGTETKHNFKNNVYVHYIENEVATTEICFCIEIDSEGDFGFYATTDIRKLVLQECIEHERLYTYDTSSFVNILEQLKKELREEKIQTLHKLVKDAGGKIEFDGSFTFAGENEGFDCENSKLLSLFMRGDDLVVKDSFEDMSYNNGTDYFPFNELDRVIEYVRSEVKSPEKMIALTDEQKVLLENFKNAFEALKNGGVGFVMDDEGKSMYAINKSNIKDFDTSYYINENKDKDSYRKLEIRKEPVIKDFLTYYIYGDEDLYAKLCKAYNYETERLI